MPDPGFIRVLVTPDQPADLLLWEDAVTQEVWLFTDPNHRPCVFLAGGNDLRGLSKDVLDEPVLIAVRNGSDPYVAPLRLIGTIEWQLVHDKEYSDSYDTANRQQPPPTESPEGSSPVQ